jgi:hypothetical protein
VGHDHIKARFLTERDTASQPGQRPATAGRRPATSDRRPAANYHRQRPTTSDERAAPPHLVHVCFSRDQPPQRPNAPSSTSLDGDGCSDPLEIFSLDDDLAVTPADVALVTASFGMTDRPNMDINKDGRVNVGDQLFVAKNLSRPPCLD